MANTYTISTINVGTYANDGQGDPLRTAFVKINQNFANVYSLALLGGNGGGNVTYTSGNGNVSVSTISNIIQGLGYINVSDTANLISNTLATVQPVSLANLNAALANVSAVNLNQLNLALANVTAVNLSNLNTAIANVNATVANITATNLSNLNNVLATISYTNLGGLSNALANVRTTILANVASISANIAANTPAPVKVVSDLSANGTVVGQSAYNTTDGSLNIWNGNSWITPQAAFTPTASSLASVQIYNGTPLPSTGNFNGRTLFWSFNNKLYIYVNGWNQYDTYIAGNGGNVTLSAGSITSGMLQSNIISSDKIIAGSITTGLIAAGAINTSQLAAGAVTANIIAANAVTAATIAAGAVTATQLAAGAVTAATIAAGSIYAGALQAGAVTASAIAANSITAVQLAANSIYAGALQAGAISANVLAANSITSVLLAANSIYAGALQAGSITTNAIAANAITTVNLAANSITAGQIATNSIYAGAIQAYAISAGNIQSNAITATQLAANAVYAGSLQANSITSAKISANAITAVQLAANSVYAGALTANSIVAGTIAANAVTAVNLAANAVTANSILANTITGIHISAGSITADKINSRGLTIQDANGNTLFGAGVGAGSGYGISSSVAITLPSGAQTTLGAIGTNSSTSPITFIGTYSAAPSGKPVNSVYTNSTDGNTYVYNGTTWVLFVPKGTNGTNGTNGSNGSNGTNGAPGAAGSAGPTGTRGTVTLNVPVGGSSWSDSSATTQILIYTQANGSTPTTPIYGDIITEYNSSANYSETRFWAGYWATASAYINGNLIVNGTIDGSKIVAGSVQTTQIASSAIGPTQLSASSVTPAKLGGSTTEVATLTGGTFSLGSASGITAYDVHNNPITFYGMAVFNATAYNYWGLFGSSYYADGGAFGNDGGYNSAGSGASFYKSYYAGGYNTGYWVSTGYAATTGQAFTGNYFNPGTSQQVSNGQLASQYYGASGTYYPYGLSTSYNSFGELGAFDGSNYFGGYFATRAAGNFQTFTALASSTKAGEFRSYYAGSSSIQSGVFLGYGGYSFYNYSGAIALNGGTLTSFTGTHDSLLNNSEVDLIVMGDIVVDTVIVGTKGINDAVSIVTRSTEPMQKSVFGVATEFKDLTTDGYLPHVFSTTVSNTTVVSRYNNAANVETRTITDDTGNVITISSNTSAAYSNVEVVTSNIILDSQYTELLNQNKILLVNGVGEGLINVCGENGNIEIGDYITTSSIPGKGMKQNDDLMHNYTVAKARESVTFDSPTDVKLIACTYHCG